MREDTFTNTVGDAAAYEQLRAADEWIGPDTEAFAEVRPACRVCQHASRSTYVCGPCVRGGAA